MTEHDEDDYSQPPLDVHNLDEMDYHVRRAAEAQQEIDRLNGIYRAEIDRLTNRWTEQVRILQGRRDWHLAPVESYHRAHPKERTISFVYGDSKLRASSIKPEKAYTIGDKDAVIEWASAHHPEVLTQSPSIAAIRKLEDVVVDGGKVVDTSTGEIVHGLEAYEPEDSWSLAFPDEDGL
jgi:hypothetical protein